MADSNHTEDASEGLPSRRDELRDEYDSGLDGLGEPESDEDDEGICIHCSGSGEGQYDGATCRWCKGSGVSRG